MPRDPIEITGITLIEKVLEFVAMIPDSSNWVFNQMKLNSSYEIRYRQIDVLLNYFTPEIYNKQDLKISIKHFLQGDFIELRPLSVYKDILAEMDNTIQTGKITMPQQRPWLIGDITSNYCDLINFRKKLNRLLMQNNGIMEISYPYLFSVEITDQIIRNIDTKIMDKFLGLVIDPSGQMVTKERLVNDYNYPTEDVYEIDADNW